MQLDWKVGANRIHLLVKRTDALEWFRHLQECLHFTSYQQIKRGSRGVSFWGLWKVQQHNRRVKRQRLCTASMQKRGDLSRIVLPSITSVYDKLEIKQGDKDRIIQTSTIVSPKQIINNKRIWQVRGCSSVTPSQVERHQGPPSVTGIHVHYKISATSVNF